MEPPPRLRITHERTGTVLAERARLAATFWTRFRGLLGTSSLAPGEGLVLDPCSAVHTIGMKYAIDVVFTTGEGVVVEVCPRLAPGGRSPIVRGARLAVELPEGHAADVRTGDTLRFDASA